MPAPYHLAGLALLGLAACAPAPAAPPSAVLPDLSGLAWIEGDRFLAVHDAKAGTAPEAPRVSVLTAARDRRPMERAVPVIAWPEGAPSHDLECVARVPGTDTYLLAESGDDASASRRVFVTQWDGRALRVLEAASWPVEVFNVEGCAVVRSGAALYFVFAERADGASSTQIAWARLGLSPFALSDLRAVAFPHPAAPGPHTRPVSALDVDASGVVYAASSEDPDRDDGPFRSAVWRVGRFVVRGDSVALALDAPPARLGTLDGLKVESIAVRERAGSVEVFVGTDDEGWGGVLRRLPVEAGGAE